MDWQFRLIIAFGFFLVTVNSTKKRYNGYIVFRMWSSSDVHETVINEMALSFDFWVPYSEARGWALVMVAPHQEGQLRVLLFQYGIKYKVVIRNVQRIIDQNDIVVHHTLGVQVKEMTWDAYHSLDRIYSWFDFLQKIYPTKVEVVNAGTSYEGRRIKGIKISTKKTNRSAVIESGIHAREWLGPALVTFIINILVKSIPGVSSKLADVFIWYIFPVINVDGYNYTFTEDRLWKNSRSKHYRCKGKVVGVDLNMNFQAKVQPRDSVYDPCSECFAGDKAFSEVETLSYSHFLRGVKNLDMFLTFHSFGQEILIPFDEGLLEYPEMNAIEYDIASEAARAIWTRYKTNYTVGKLSEFLDTQGCSSAEWVMSTIETPMVYHVNLRDRGKYGFLYPASRIMENNLEIYDALVALVKTGKKLHFIMDTGTNMLPTLYSCIAFLAHFVFNALF